jgi:elongation factor Ts
MADVPARLVKELRDRTSAPMMQCKRALVETGGDLEKAERLLREWGMASAGKRAGRKIKEGKVLTRIDDGRGAIVAVGCETEPVAKNEEFVAFARRLLEAVELEGPDAAEKLDEDRVQLVATIGENIEVRGAARLEASDGEVLSAYVHPPAEKIGVLVRLAGSPDLARLLAMHISFANPRYLSREEVPGEAVTAEREIYEKLPEVVSKPEHIRPKIVEGMLAKRFYAESVLLEQPWIHDDSMTVGQALGEHGAEVREFVRYTVTG